jgi:hypothetical protein
VTETELAAFGGTVLLLIALLPTGLLILRGTERTLRRRFPFTIVERGVLAFYAAGGLFFVIASIPLPIYGVYSVSAIVLGGTAGYLALLLRERGRSWGDVVGFIRSPIGIGLGAGFLGLLALELFPVAAHAFPNAWDGSETALWMTLTLQNHTLPTTLLPYADAGVTYPLGTTVWMTLPVLLLGWSIVSTPVLLPPLFAALTVPAAYCWGSRLAGPPLFCSGSIGVVFAAFFALVASWPRLAVGGSYDFAFALPGLLVLFGLVRVIVDRPVPTWKLILPFGIAAGVLTSLSLVAGEVIVVVLVANALAFRPWSLLGLWSWLGRALAVIALEGLFVLRSVANFFVWFGYPSHVLDQIGGPPIYGPSVFGPLGARLIEGDLDPFLQFKPRMSPFPLLATELQVMLGAAIFLAILVARRPNGRTSRLLPPGILRSLLSTSFVLFAATVVSLLGDWSGWVSGLIAAVTSFDETSTLFFLSLQALAIVPILAAITLVRGETWWEPKRVRTTEAPRTRGRSRWSLPGRVQTRGRGSWTGVLAVVILVPFASGIWITATQVPGYLDSIVGKTAHVSSGDVGVMQWVGTTLPGCSSVFAAPGSAAQFLPEYAHVHLVFQMTPTPLNGSYYVAVLNLSAGVYSNQTRAALLSLGVTEVFVTGQTSVSFPPLEVQPLATSPDFADLDHQGDAYVFAFEPGIAAAGCPP